MNVKFVLSLPSSIPNSEIIDLVKDLDENWKYSGGYQKNLAPEGYILGMYFYRKGLDLLDMSSFIYSASCLLPDCVRSLQILIDIGTFQK